MKSRNYRNKKNNIVIVILVLLVLILGGYLVYDKLLIDNEINKQNNDYVVELDNYKNYDGSYGSIKKLYFDDGTNGIKYYYIDLRLDGKVYYGDYKDDTEDILLDENIVDIVSFANGAGDVLVNDCYMLDENGNVYKYKLSDLIDGDVTLEKVNVSNVVRLIHVDWTLRENAGGSWGLIAVTKDGDYVELIRASV